MKKLSKLDFVSIIILIFNFILGLYLSPKLPTRVPTHWNMQGQINGYSGKEFITWQMPLLITGIFLLMTVLPMIDPKRRNYQKFSGTYDIMKFLIVIFMSIILWLSTATALGIYIDMKLVIPMLIGLLFIILGAIMPKVKQNYFVGYKTPWAIENEQVWNKTQKVGGLIFIIGGILMILTSLTPFNYLFFVVIILMVLSTFVYSYLEYRKLKK